MNKPEKKIVIDNGEVIGGAKVIQKVAFMMNEARNQAIDDCEAYYKPIEGGVRSKQELLKTLNNAHYIDIRVRINGEYRFYEGDFIKPFLRAIAAFS